MNAVSKLISKIVRSEHTNVNDNKKMITDKKYLLISDWSIKLSLKIILFVYIWFGLLCDNKSFSENLIKLYTLKKRNPELVEKSDPPIITKIIYIKFKFELSVWKENPIFDILVTIEVSVIIKFLL